MIEGCGYRRPRPELETTCCFIGTTAAIIMAIGAGVSAGSSVYAAKKGSDASEHAADLQTEAANHAADDQLQGNREGIAYQQQLARYQAQQAEVDRQANYNQWRARQQKLGSIGTMLGLGGVSIPDYVPGAQPDFSAMPGGGNRAPMPGGPGGGGPMPVGRGQTPAAAAMYRSRVPNFGMVTAGGQLPVANSMPTTPQAPAGMNLGPYANDWTPRDPRTGQPLYGSFGAMMGA